MINPDFLSTDELYFADKEFMSVSRFKKFLKCEVDGMTDWSEPTSSMKVGSYVDAHMSGVLDKFKEDNPDIISSRGVSKGQLKAEFKKAEEVIEFMDNDPTIQQFLNGDKQTSMTGKIAGVPFKIKIDIYSEGIAINDLKCMQTITNSDGEYYDFISKWGYHYQMGAYQEIVRQNTGNILPCFIIAVTKESPVNSAIINIPQTTLDVALYEILGNIGRFYDIWKGEVDPIGCGKCKSCIGSRKETPIISMDELL